MIVALYAETVVCCMAFEYIFLLYYTTKINFISVIRRKCGASTGSATQPHPPVRVVPIHLYLRGELRGSGGRSAGHESTQSLRRKSNHVLHRVFIHYRRHVRVLHLF